MDVMKLRKAFLAGASVAALAMGTPAAAAVIAGVEHDVADANVDDTLIISLAGDPPVTFGDIEHEAASATAFLNFVSDGALVQVGFGSGTGTASGNANVLIENGGTAFFVASAVASNSGGPAEANAGELEDIFQVGAGVADATARIENTGGLEARAAAAAKGSMAEADVLFDSVVFQQAIGNRADAGILNSGLFHVIGSAVATATVGAALASMEMNGVHEFASGVTGASVHFTNMADFRVTGVAHANGVTGASALASVSYAARQSASATEPVSVNLDNAGLIRIGAAATAKADGLARAGAAVDAGLVQLGDSLDGDDLIVHNSGTYDVSGIASANAGPDGVAFATGLADWFFQSAFAQSQTISFSSAAGVFLSISNVPRGPAFAQLSNTGDMMLLASAHVRGGSGFALAGATAGTQTVDGSPASAAILNSGKMDVLAVAEATATHLAGAAAFASGLHQLASAHSSHFFASSVSSAGHAVSDNEGFGPATLSFVNNGAIDIAARAHAVVTGTGLASQTGLIVAAATAVVPVAILQGAVGTNAKASLENSGTILVAGTATATGPQDVEAQANETGIVQAAQASGISATAMFSPSAVTSSFNRFFQGPAQVELTNSGSIDVTGLLDASAGGFARIDAHAVGIDQIARGSTAAAVIVNDDNLTIGGSGHVHGASETGFVFDSGIHQRAIASKTALASVHNSGEIKVFSRDIGSAIAGVATNVAIASGVAQSATVATPFGASAAAFGTATASFENSGSLSVEAQAKADGVSVALGVAFAADIRQAPIFGTLKAELDNKGDISALAEASAAAHSGPAFATAHATNYFVEAANVVAGVVNEKTIEALASAHVAGSGGSAFAFAAGISVNALSLGTPAAFGDISGTITNKGLLQVAAKVDSASSGTVGAVATGIFLSAPVNIDATVTNTGTIDVTAIAAHQNAQAWGIHVFDFAPDIPPDSGRILIINNSGAIVARQSNDGGKTFKHGLAIDVANAPNATVINLLGGNIYGNIDINAGDQINVASGTTYFDGIINPEFMPVHTGVTGVTTADLDSGLFGEGDLNIDNGGVLELADPRFSGDPSMYDGPAYAFVDTLNMGPDGTIAFQLEPATGGDQTPGTYPQVFADTANLAGTLAVDIQPKNGLLANSYFWDNVIDANTLVGTFDTCGTKIGPLGGSLFLGPVTCTYDANNNVDLSVSRIPFTAIVGLNDNGTAAAGGLECIYSPTLTGGIGKLFANLFLFDNVNNLNVALNQLAGASYANYLDSFPSLGVHYNDLVDHATNCEIPALAGSVLECRASSPIHIWGQLDYQWRHTDGDNEAGSGKARRFTGLVGIDTIISNAAFVGIEGGYVSNRYHDSLFGDDLKGTGWQLGVYGDYDPGAFFLKGNVTYNSFNGSSTRNIDFNGLAPGATFTSTVRGDPNVKMWTAGLHGGARFPLGGSSVATPYLNLDYVHAKMDGFIETNAAGTTGAELHLDSNSASHFFVTPGVKFATQFGGVVPELNLGYRYRFGEQRADINEAFQCQIDTCAFDVVGGSHKRGTFLAGLSIGGKFGAVDVRVAYEGEFNGDVTSHSGNFKIVVPLGGHAAPPPPPPPPPEMAPPPPPPPHPPPTPAPVERGERGT